MNEMRCFKRLENDNFLKLMNKSIETMIIESVGMNPENYSPEYLQILESNSPLRFNYIRKKRSQSKSQRFAFFKKYFEQASPEIAV